MKALANVNPRDFIDAVEKLRQLAGQPITPELARRAGEAAVEGANPLAKNAYKVPLTKALVRPALVWLAQRA